MARVWHGGWPGARVVSGNHGYRTQSCRHLFGNAYAAGWKTGKRQSRYRFHTGAIALDSSVAHPSSHIGGSGSAEFA